MSPTVFEALSDEETIAAFREKGYAAALDRFSYRDIWARMHARRFTVAKALSDDVLGAIRKAVDEAIAEGVTYETFLKKLEPVLKDLGWWGRDTMIDPRTGLTEEVQLGSARRLRIIYDTNLRSARAAGRWERAQRNKALMPYFQYIQVDRPSKRDAHKPFDGIVLPVDHPLWKTHWPPNGWQCGCYARQVSKARMRRETLEVTPEDRVDEISETRAVHDKRNGVTRQVPKGIDPSFEHNAGLSRYDPDAA